MDPITVSMGLGLFAAGGGLGWWLTKTHETLDGLGDGMILLQEAQASSSAMMGKRMDGLDERIQRLVAGLDGVRAAHPELDGTILAFEALQGQGEAIQALETLVAGIALDADHEMLTVLNKMDLPGAMPEEVTDQIIDLIGCNKEDIIPASGKTGMGIDNILKAIINKIPSPEGSDNQPLEAMIFDSVFNSFRGIIAYFRVFNGVIKKGQQVKFFNTGKIYNADEIGVLKMDLTPKNELRSGDVGYIISGVKKANEVKVGDTITSLLESCENAIQGFEDVKPMVFAGMYPVETDDYEELRNSMEKLQLNDASLVFEPESSAALGFGFRCGFLGMLHMEIIQERLEREFNMVVITTVPNVSYNVFLKKDLKQIVVNNPSELPDPSKLEWIEEPYIKAQVITKTDYVGAVMNLCIEKRGELNNQVYLTQDRVELSFQMPLSEIVFDFYDRLKSVSRGYASFDYSPVGHKKSDLIKLDILLNSEQVDALSALVHRSNAFTLGKRICLKLKELIPRQQFEIPIQAAIGAKIVSRETVKALRKDVTAKCYGGDITRKRKLLEKQKAGKKRMRQVGRVEVPQEAFLAVLKLD